VRPVAVRAYTSSFESPAPQEPALLASPRAVEPVTTPDDRGNGDEHVPSAGDRLDPTAPADGAPSADPAQASATHEPVPTAALMAST